MIVIDMKGELAAVTARKRAEMGRVIILNPFEVGVEERPWLKSQGWNPLLQLDPQSNDFEGDATCIADAIIEKGFGAGKFFQDMAQIVVAGLVMWECFTKGKNASLCSIPNELCKPADELLHTFKSMAECKKVEAIKRIGGYLHARLTDENSRSTAIQDVVATIISSTSFLDHPSMTHDLEEGSGIDFAALRREITTVYLILPPHEIETQAKWLRLFVNLSLRKLYQAPPSKAGHSVPVVYMLDEFGNLGWLSQIQTALSVSRSYKIQLWVFLQYVGQLKASYGDKWTAFFAGAGAITTFRAGDSETAEELFKLYGNKEELVPTLNAQGGISNTPHAVPLIRPEDIGRLDKGVTINLIEGCPMPIVGFADIYPRLSTAMIAGLDPHPDYPA